MLPRVTHRKVWLKMVVWMATQISGCANGNFVNFWATCFYLSPWATKACEPPLRVERYRCLKSDNMAHSVSRKKSLTYWRILFIQTTVPNVTPLTSSVMERDGSFFSVSGWERYSHEHTVVGRGEVRDLSRIVWCLLTNWGAGWFQPAVLASNASSVHHPRWQLSKTSRNRNSNGVVDLAVWVDLGRLVPLPLNQVPQPVWESGQSSKTRLGYKCHNQEAERVCVCVFLTEWYLMTSQTRVICVSRIHHRTIFKRVLPMMHLHPLSFDCPLYWFQVPIGDGERCPRAAVPMSNSK